MAARHSQGAFVISKDRFFEGVDMVGYFSLLVWGWLLRSCAIYVNELASRADISALWLFTMYQIIDLAACVLRRKPDIEGSGVPQVSAASLLD